MSGAGAPPAAAPRAALALLAFLAPAIAANPPIADLKITVLSTMLSDRGVGEWGFAALVESGNHKILFDTGYRPETVLTNASEMKIDLTQITEVILSHNHGDHTGGLIALRKAVMKTSPKALAKAWVAEGIFLEGEGRTMSRTKAAYEALGGKFEVLREPRELWPGAWLTGPVPRKHPEQNYSGNDKIPEDQSLILDTTKGLVVVAGCGHAGIINTFDYARQKIRPAAPIHAAIGGFHLFSANDQTLAWTSAEMKKAGLQHFLGAHCTGIEAVYKVRDATGLGRRTCVVGAVGGIFDLDKGILPGVIAR